MRPPRLLCALLLAAVPVAGACGSDDGSSASSDPAATVTTGTTTSEATASTVPTPTTVTLAGESVPVARLAGYSAAICEAARQAATDIDAARKTFNGRAHDGLHLIARGLEAVDRAAAAVLLEAKQKVEADFSKPPPAAQLVADLNSLADVTRSSLARFQVTVDACPSA